MLIVGQQVRTDFGGYIDLLAIDSEGHVHVLELKRDRTPRDVVAQTLDYGAWVQSLGLADLSTLYQQHRDGDLDEDFAARFGQPLPDVINADQQLTVIASGLDPASDRIIEYLAETYGVPINALFFQYFVDDDREYLTRTWLLDPAAGEATAARRTQSKAKPWNGRDFYSVQGRLDQGSDRWDAGRTYGFVSAGGGNWYWKPLRNLAPGHRVFAYVGGAGYVGIGTVTGPIGRMADFQLPDGTMVVDHPELDEDFRTRARQDDEAITEFVVPVEWDVAKPVSEAVMAAGLFASQLSACKLTDDRTIEFVTRALGAADGPDHA